MFTSINSNNENNEGKNKGKEGRPVNEVWTHFVQGERDSEGHASATCKYCQYKYMRGTIVILQGHIANYCMEASITFVREYQEKLADNKTSRGKKRKGFKGQIYLDEYHDSDKPLPQGRIDRIERALIKFFICCGVSFRVVESPFFIDFLKELNSSYNLPSRDTLTNRLLKRELGYVNLKVSKELDSTENLTLGAFIVKK